MSPFIHIYINTPIFFARSTSPPNMLCLCTTQRMGMNSELLILTHPSHSALLCTGNGITRVYTSIAVALEA